MLKIKIGTNEFNLKNYYQGSNNNRPCWVFNIEESYDTIKPLITENQTYSVLSSVDTEEEEPVISERDLTDECVLFYSLLDRADGTSQLTMENYSDVELLQQMIKDLLEA